MASVLFSLALLIFNAVSQLMNTLTVILSIEHRDWRGGQRIIYILRLKEGQL